MAAPIRSLAACAVSLPRDVPYLGPLAEGESVNARGYIARGGQIVDATIVSAPKQHNSREENEAIKAVLKKL